MESSYWISPLGGSSGTLLATFRFTTVGSYRLQCNNNTIGRLCIEDTGVFPTEVARALISIQVSSDSPLINERTSSVTKIHYQPHWYLTPKASDATITLTRGLWRTEQWDRKPADSYTLSSPGNDDGLLWWWYLYLLKLLNDISILALSLFYSGRTANC